MKNLTKRNCLKAMNVIEITKNSSTTSALVFSKCASILDVLYNYVI
jgi:hypothetical protein